MAVARIHGKVKCRPFKEEKGGGHHLQNMASQAIVSCCFPLLNLIFCLRFCDLVERKRSARPKFPSCLLLLRPPGIKLQWLVVSKGPNLFEIAL